MSVEARSPIVAATLGPSRPVSPSVLPVAAVAHLAHEIRGSLHTILGHAALLALDAADAESRTSTRYIHDAAERLLGLGDDLTDVLRLPELPDRGEARLSLGALADSCSLLAAARGVRVRVDAAAHADGVMLDGTVHRVVSHVVEQIARAARADVTVGASAVPTGDAHLITVEPAPDDALGGCDGVMALAATLLAARGGRIDVAGARVHLLVPISQPA